MALHTIVEHDTTHIKPYIDNVKQALSNEVSARATLGTHNIFPFVYSLDTWIDSDCTKAESSGVVTYTATGSYARVGYWYPNALEVGKKYVINFKKKCTFSANAIRLQFATTQTMTTSDPSMFKVFEYTASDADYVEETYEFTATSTDLMFGVYVQAGSGTGNVIAIKEIQITLATDTDTTYQPYAMTNKELTDGKAEKSDLASISITGTTNSTGATIASGTYFYLNGSLVKAKTSIASAATLTLNTNYEVVTAGGLNSVPHFLSGTFTNMQSLPIDGTITDYTIPEDGYYGAYAVNDDVAGAANLNILDSTHNFYIFSCNHSESANYQRVACPPIPLRKGAVIAFRAWATNRAYVYKIT